MNVIHLEYFRLLRIIDILNLYVIFKSHASRLKRKKSAYLYKRHFKRQNDILKLFERRSNI